MQYFSVGIKRNNSNHHRADMYISTVSVTSTVPLLGSVEKNWPVAEPGY